MSTKARKTEEVDDHMTRLDHPFKGEVQALRDIILTVSAADDALQITAPAGSPDALDRNGRRS